MGRPVTIDPLTGQPRKVGRPRKDPSGRKAREYLPNMGWEMARGWDALHTESLGILWGTRNKEGKLYLRGKLATDAGDIDVAGFPFLTKKFQVGVIVSLGRTEVEEGVWVRADGKVQVAKPLDDCAHLTTKSRRGTTNGGQDTSQRATEKAQEGR